MSPWALTARNHSWWLSRGKTVALLFLLPTLLTGCSNSEDAVANEHPTAPGRTFVFNYRATVNEVPATAETAFLWIPFPPSIVDQTILLDKIDTNLPYEEVIDAKFGNRALRFVLLPGTAKQTVTVVYRVSRRDRVRSTTESYPGDNAIPAADPALWLTADLFRKLGPEPCDVHRRAQHRAAGNEGSAAQLFYLSLRGSRWTVVEPGGTPVFPPEPGNQPILTNRMTNLIQEDYR